MYPVAEATREVLEIFETALSDKIRFKNNYMFFAT